MARRSRQRKHGGGKFKSESQRRFMWANAPKAAKRWAHNLKTRSSDWRGAKRRSKGRAGDARRADRHDGR